MPRVRHLKNAFLDAYEAAEAPFPQFKMSLTTYDKINRHKYYRVDITMIARTDSSTQVKVSNWRQQRRLGALRRDLHDVVKSKLGDETYQSLFHPDFRFPGHTGFAPGTVERLQKWIERLSDLINHGKLSPKVVEVVLDFWFAPSFCQAELVQMPSLPWSEADPMKKLQVDVDSEAAPGLLRPCLAGQLAQDLPRHLRYEQMDSAGTYVILEETMVSSVEDFTLPKSKEVGRLRPGTFVNVTRVIRREDLQRVRASIEEPAGFISLLDISIEYRWAKKVEKEPGVSAPSFRAVALAPPSLPTASPPQHSLPVEMPSLPMETPTKPFSQEETPMMAFEDSDSGSEA